MKSHREQSEEAKKTGEAPETMTQKDAAMFPIIASCALFGLYIFFQVEKTAKSLHSFPLPSCASRIDRRSVYIFQIGFVIRI